MHELSKSIVDYKSLKTTIKDLEQKLTAIEDKIKDYMGGEEEIIVDGNTIRWQKITQTRFDSKMFSQQHAALYEQFLKPSEIRRFTIT